MRSMSPSLYLHSARHMTLSTSLCYTKSSFIPSATPSILYPCAPMSYIMQAEPSVTRTVTAVRSTTLVLCKERAVVNICHTAMHLVAVDNHLVPPRFGGASGSKTPGTIEVSESRDVCGLLNSHASSSSMFLLVSVFMHFCHIHSLCQ